ncbi:MAG TPA: FAD-dependent oxidoreductase [Puia sp.]
MPEPRSTDCCIVGGGPAGMMAGFLLARCGISVMVLEKHKDFFRDFRGDTIHPSTFQIMHELGLLEAFRKVPHQEISSINALFNGRSIRLVDFSHLKLALPAAGVMPQWDFLNFIAKQAEQFPTFSLIREANVTGLLKNGDGITGVTALTPDGPLEVHARLVIGADGRSSVIRQAAGLKVIDTGAPIDVLWFRLTHRANDPDQAFGNFYYGKILVMLNRGQYWQCGFIIEKGGFEQLKAKGMGAFTKELTTICPFLDDRVQELRDWSDVKLLSVKIDHLETWYRAGLICIGDAAHAMSPVGGVGINLAIQDAVAAANRLYKPLQSGLPIPIDILRSIQKRRVFPTRVTQALQVSIQKGIVTGDARSRIPLIVRLIDRFPFLRRIPAMIIGNGIRPEHVHAPCGV